MKTLHARRSIAALIVGVLFAALSAPAHGIINGTPAGAGEFSSIVAIGSASDYASDGDMSRAMYCGGVLIGQRLVLTAAHCIVEFNDQTKISRISRPDELVVGGGTNDLSQMSGAQVTTVLRLDPTPKYLLSLAMSNGDRTTDDIAILQLAATIPNTTPIALATAAQVATINNVATQLETAGWGDQSPFGSGTYSDLLMRTTLVSVSDAVCADPDSRFSLSSPSGSRSAEFTGLNSVDAPYFDAPSMLCAGGVNEAGARVDTCVGDSGGPVTAVIDGVPTVVAVTSWGPAIGQAICGIDEPSVYAEASLARVILQQYQAPQPTVVTSPTSFKITQNRWDYNLGSWTFAVLEGSSTIGSCTVQPDPITGTASCTVTGLRSNTYYYVRTEPTTGRASIATRLYEARYQPTKPSGVKIVGTVNKKIVSTKYSRIGLRLSAAANYAPISRYTVTCVSSKLKSIGKSTKNLVQVLNLVRGRSYVCSATATNSEGTSVPFKFNVKA